MHMQRDDTRRARASHGGIEQHGRVETAAERNREASIAGEAGTSTNATRTASITRRLAGSVGVGGHGR